MVFNDEKWSLMMKNGHLWWKKVINDEKKMINVEKWSLMMKKGH